MLSSGFGAFFNRSFCAFFSLFAYFLGSVSLGNISLGRLIFCTAFILFVSLRLFINRKSFGCAAECGEVVVLLQAIPRSDVFVFTGSKLAVGSFLGYGTFFNEGKVDRGKFFNVKRIFKSGDISNAAVAAKEEAKKKEEAKAKAKATKKALKDIDG